jgi:quinol monooxygenase YgiN
MDLPIVELRRYTLVPGRRDEMIDVFERHLMESQEEAGMSLLGTFRDLDRPDHFVWLRGFPDMESRRASLTAFYSGPVWKRYGPAVRPTMIDTDDVHLLRPKGPGLGAGPLPPVDADEPGSTIYVAMAEIPDAFATFVTEPTENTYPALPVHEGVDVTVSLSRTRHDAAARLAPTSRSPLR